MGIVENLVNPITKREEEKNRQEIKNKGEVPDRMKKEKGRNRQEIQKQRESQDRKSRQDKVTVRSNSKSTTLQANGCKDLIPRANIFHADYLVSDMCCRLGFSFHYIK